MDALWQMSHFKCFIFLINRLILSVLCFNKVLKSKLCIRICSERQKPNKILTFTNKA